MNNQLLAACLILAGCSDPQALSGAGKAAMPPDPREVTEAVDGFHSALRGGDFEAVSALLDPHVLVLESGGAERSREEYLASHAKLDAEFLAGVTGSQTASALQVAGGVAWATATSEQRFERDGKPAAADVAETMILRRGPDGWKIVHIHWSSRARP